MLPEFIKYLFTPSSKPVRRMGLLMGSIGTKSRYQRCKKDWQPHLENTRNLILEAASTVSARGSVTVYGSGNLLDVPLEELSHLFKKVTLVDIIHPLAARRASASYDNVSIVDADVTHTIESVYETVRLGDPLPHPPPVDRAPPLPGITADLVVSVNMLSQLPVIPRKFIEQAGGAYTEDDIVAFARALIDFHLETLERALGTVCLITDVERQYCDGEEILDTLDVVYGASVERDAREWIWDIAPRPEMHRKLDVRCRVRGCYWDSRNTNLAAP